MDPVTSVSNLNKTRKKLLFHGASWLLKILSASDVGYSLQQIVFFLIAQSVERPLSGSDQVDFATLRTSCPQAAAISDPSE